MLLSKNYIKNVKGWKMRTFRVIPRLDIKGPDLVKGVHLEGLRVLGRPRDFAKFYYESGADELIYMDVVASLYGRNSLHEMISEAAQEISIPLLVGGGIRTLDDIQKVLRAGADRVSLNTAAVNNPGFVKEAVREFGASTIVVSIEAIKTGEDNYLAYTDNGREHTGLEVVDWAKKMEGFGVGEIMITSVDREGTGKGFDIGLTKKIASCISIPVVAHGGCSSSQNAVEVITETGCDAVAVSAALHYDVVKNNKSIICSNREGNTAFLRSGKMSSTFPTTSIEEIKNSLLSNGLQCRH